MTTDLELLQYPVGKFAAPASVAAEDRIGWLHDITDLPSTLRAALGAHTENDLERPYRPGGWTVRQVVHHLADGHSNAYMRFKLALTEDNPTIKPYGEALWAALPDSSQAPIGSSLHILSGVHERWTHLMHSMSDEQWLRTFYHPQYQRTSSLHNTLALYAWHSRHHVGHVRLALGR